MKIKHVVRILGLAVLISLVVTSCAILAPKMSINDRLTSFANHLSNDRANCYTDFKEATAGYVAGAAGVFGTSNFPNGTYTITGINSSNSTAVTATITGPGPFSLGYPVVFNMGTNLAGDAAIVGININNGTISF